MANQDNIRTQKQDLNQRQPPQQSAQADGAKNAGKKASERGKTTDQKSRPFAPGQSPRQPNQGSSDSRR